MNFQPHLAVNLLSIVPGRIGGAEEYAVRTLLAFSKYRSLDIRPVFPVAVDPITLSSDS